MLGWPGPLTARQCAAWVAWRNTCDVQLAPPSLTDWQLMRVAQRVQQVLSRSPNSIKLEDQRVEFVPPDGVGGRGGDGSEGGRTNPTPEQIAAWSNAKWLSVARKAPGFWAKRGSGTELRARHLGIKPPGNGEPPQGQ